MRELLQMQTYQQIMGGGGAGGANSVWLKIAFLVGLFIVLFWRPETMKHHTLFRWSCTLLALSIMIPPFVTMGTYLYMGESFGGGIGSARGGGTSWPMILLQISRSCGPALFGMSMMFGFASLMPIPVIKPPAVAEKGPFD